MKTKVIAGLMTTVSLMTFSQAQTSTTTVTPSSGVSYKEKSKCYSVYFDAERNLKQQIAVIDQDMKEKRDRFHQRNVGRTQVILPLTTLGGAALGQSVINQNGSRGIDRVLNIGVAALGGAIIGGINYAMAEELRDDRDHDRRYREVRPIETERYSAERISRLINNSALLKYESEKLSPGLKNRMAFDIQDTIFSYGDSTEYEFDVVNAIVEIVVAWDESGAICENGATMPIETLRRITKELLDKKNNKKS